MHEETLAELLRSPLDDDQPSHERSWPAFALLGIVAGALLGLGWIALQAGHESVAAESPVTPAGDAAAVAPFPGGFVRVSETAAMRPDARYSNGGATVVVLTTVTQAGTPPEQSPVFAGGVWELRDVEGRVVDGYEELRNPASLGTVAVRFPGADRQLRSIVLTPLTEPEVITASVPIDLPRFPLTTGRSFEVPLASDLRLRGLLVTLDGEGGDVRWELRGADALAQVDLVVSLPETAAADGIATNMMSEHIAPPYPFQRQRLPRPAPLEAGTDVVRRAGPEIADPTAVRQAVIDVTVRLYRIRDDASVEFDVRNLPVVSG